MNLIKTQTRAQSHHPTIRLADKTKMLALDLTELSLDEVAKITRHINDAHSRFNESRCILILEFENQEKKVDYMKRLPQWLWNQGGVLWECSNEQLETWIYETLLNW